MVRVAAVVCVAAVAVLVHGREIVVAPVSGEFSLIQAALDTAQPGDMVTVRAGTYVERLTFPRGGDDVNGPIVLRAQPGERVVVSGNNQSSASSPHLISIFSLSHITIAGLDVCSNVATEADGGSAMYLEGAGSDITLVSNRIYWIRGMHGMGITVYGTEAGPWSNIVVAHNEIRDCEPATSEALTFNGNISGFSVVSNYVHDVNNIGMDFIGGEAGFPGGARNGVCVGNTVLRARSLYGGGYGAGIYVDGGRSIVIERNRIAECDLGIEIGAENAGWVASNITVRSNLVYLNDKAGIGFGGYASNRGRVTRCEFANNTFWRNNELAQGPGDFHGEVIIQFSSSNIFRNNLVVVSGKGELRAILDSSTGANVGNRFDYNLYSCVSTNVLFQWRTDDYEGFAAYTNAAGAGDHAGLWADPALEDGAATNFHLLPTSPAIDRGDPAYEPGPGECDFDGGPRVIGGRIDLGAYEGVPEPGLHLAHAAWVLTLLRFRCIIKKQT